MTSWFDSTQAHISNYSLNISIWRLNGHLRHVPNWISYSTPPPCLSSQTCFQGTFPYIIDGNSIFQWLKPETASISFFLSHSLQPLCQKIPWLQIPSKYIQSPLLPIFTTTILIQASVYYLLPAFLKNIHPLSPLYNLFLTAARMILSKQTVSVLVIILKCLHVLLRVKTQVLTMANKTSQDLSRSDPTSPCCSFTRRHPLFLSLLLHFSLAGLAQDWHELGTSQIDLYFIGNIVVPRRGHCWAAPEFLMGPENVCF